MSLAFYRRFVLPLRRSVKTFIPVGGGIKVAVGLSRGLFKVHNLCFCKFKMNTLRMFIDHLTPEFSVVEEVIQNYMVC